VLLFVVALAFALRLYRLGYQSIWWDEGANIEMALADIPTIGLNPRVPVSATAFAQTYYPPVYFYALHFWLRVAGQTEFAARFLSTAFSLLAVVLLFRLGKRLFQSRVGVLAAVLACFSPLFVHEAQEVRMYSLLLVFSILSVYLLWQAAHDGKSTYWMSYVLCTLASLYTYYTALLMLVVHCVVFVMLLVLSRRDFRFFARWVGSLAAICLLFLPQILTAFGQQFASPILTPAQLFPLPTGQLLLGTWQMLNVGLTIDLQAVIPVLATMAVVVVAGLLSRGAEDLPGGWPRLSPLILVLLWFALPFPLYWILGQDRHPFHPRHLFMKASRWIPPSLLGGGSGLAEGESPVALSSKVL